MRPSAFPSFSWLAALAVATSSTSVVAQTRAVGIPYQATYSYNLDNSLSPDGSKMVFVKVVENRAQLFTMNIDGSQERRITNVDAEFEDPAWSRDGKKIAFVKRQNGRSRIFVSNIDGSDSRPISPEGMDAIHPTWSPDSKIILFNNSDDLNPPHKNAAQIYAIDIASGKVKMLISDGINTYPVFSPDGTKIAYRKIIGERNSEVFVANADGTNQKNLTNHPAYEGWPAWSGDGKQLAFAGNRNSNYQIFVMNADGSDVTLAANTNGRATVPRWAPDGSVLYFTNCQKIDWKSGCEIMALPLSRE